jgi:GPH family glycoside/pentoside/hexuronide:cation symporter
LKDAQVNTYSERIPLGVKIAYGGAEGASSLVFTALAIYFLFFLTDVVHINASIAGTILFASTVWNALADLTMGIVSDRTSSRYGRRRPYILGVAVPFAICSWLMFTVPSLRGFALIVYYLIVSLLMYLAITVLDVPYTALAPEMTNDYDERTSLVSYRVVWSQIGSIAASTPLLIVKRFSDPKVGWSVTGALFGIICIFPILLTWRFTRGWERYPADSEPLNFKEVARALAGNRSFRCIVGIFLFSTAAVYASGSIAMYFLRYRMHFTEEKISVFFLFFFICTALWVPIVTFASNRLGKRGAFMLLMTVWALVCGFGNFLVQPGQAVFMYALCVLGAVGAGTTFQLCWAMIPDAVEVDEFKTGRRREGLFYGVAIFILKIGSAFALLIVGQVLETIGYAAGVADQAPGVILGLRIMFGPMLAGMIAVSIIIAYFLPMTRERHRELLKAIEAKNAGQPWNEESFRALL